MSHCFAITTEGEEALAAATAETLLQLRGATTVQGALIGFGFALDGVSGTAEPIRVRLLRQTTDGTATAATEEPFDPTGPAAAQCAGFHSFTAEPTAGVVLMDFQVHPQGGQFHYQFPLGREIKLGLAATSRIGLELTAPAIVNASGYLHWEE